MSNEATDYFGNRIKEYEGYYTEFRVEKFKPFVARIDGKGFSKYTNSFQKPFDEKLSTAFKNTTHRLIVASNATCGYTQSDEITLVFDGYENPLSSHWFDGKISKLNSVLSSMATAFFVDEIVVKGYSETLPFFDCRVFSVPNRIESSNAVLWRVQDAKKNSISSFARWTIGHKMMQNLSGQEMIDLVYKETGKHWSDLPHAFKYGTLLKGKDETPVFEGIYFGKLSLEERIEFVTK